MAKYNKELMMKYLLTLILLVATSVFGQSSDNLKKDVVVLSKLSRVSGTDDCKEAAIYLQTQLQPLGYEVELQEFTYRGWVAGNVLATKKAALNTVIVVGAHYDVVRAPGADDNASGTACVLELARLFKNKKTRHVICFQLYAGEEQGLIGSAFYCKYPKWSIEKHIFMLNLDMVSRLKTTTKASDLKLDKILESLFAKYSFAKKITLQNDSGSDNASFSERGIPALFLHTGLHGDYHKKSDTPEKANYQSMAEICKYAVDLVLAVDQSDIPDYSFTEK